MNQLLKSTNRRRAAVTVAALLAAGFVPSSHAYPVGRVTFHTDAPFAGVSDGSSTLTASSAGNLLTVSAWADRAATVPSPFMQWFWLLGVNSGAGNGALLDGDESMTLALEKGAGARLITFLWSGGSGGSGNGNLARLTISGFVSDPQASGITYNSPRISNLSYSAGELSLDYLNDGPGSDFGQLALANPAASAGQTLKITGAISPNGNASSWFTALYRVEVEEAFAPADLSARDIPHNSASTFTTADGKLTLRGYSDATATTPANFGREGVSDCFGVNGGPGGNVVDTTESLTMHFAAEVGLSSLESLYSGNDVSIAGFASDPGFIDPSASAVNVNYASGTLTFNIINGGRCAFYFTNRAASAGQTLRVNALAHQFGIGRLGYANVHTLLGPDVPANVAPAFTTPDGLVSLTGYADTPGTVPANLNRNYTWFGVSGGNNNESTEGAESLSLQLSAGTSLTGLGTRYTSGQVVISGFTADPGFSDPSGIATDVNYAAGTLTYTFNASASPEIVVSFSNPGASAGQTLSLHTDGNPGAQLTLTRINYATAAPAVTLSIEKAGGNVILNWLTGTLQQSTNAAAFYTDVVGATSPYTNAITAGQKYFRVKVQ